MTIIKIRLNLHFDFEKANRPEDDNIFNYLSALNLSRIEKCRRK